MIVEVGINIQDAYKYVYDRLGLLAGRSTRQAVRNAINKAAKFAKKYDEQIAKKT